MLANYSVSRMTRDELQLAIQWATNEGWNPGLHDAACFFEADPNGFFVGKLDGKIIAMGSAVVYDDQFAFCGFYMVAPEYRGQGYGLELTRQRLDYVGNRNAGIDGVLNMLNKYERLGYQIAHQNARYQGQGLPILKEFNHAIVSLGPEHHEILSAYDRKHFPAPREHFLQHWIKQPEGAALAWIIDGQIKGYGVLRACQQGFKIGPLFADNSHIAFGLFDSLVSHAHGETVYIDIPENNPHAFALVNRHAMQKCFATARMYLKGEPKLPTEHIYGITTFELG
ncbi:GNAT family acetyltransferase [Legionella rubrilucens]|uniref:GNAT family acetyltransferase n=1 Tax=Legionella rubrilucens TaxID=458 RepID=A0A0W0XLL5_9GAMM|nr:GNAT family N-acetyltransferase [Legionella rubrilucens]KTD45565.1 GNAT family acetyltransferase [Legionella rubrilucens]